MPVEQVQMIMDAMLAEDRYSGMVISEDVTQVMRDSNMTVSQIFVSEGTSVTSGQSLFAYDADALRLELDRERLKLEKLKNEKSNNAAQLKNLQESLNKAKDEVVKTQLKIQIGTLENDQKQLEFDLRAQTKTISNMETAIRNVVVYSPVSGTIRKINTGDNTAEAFITIQQSGAYRIKGKLNEMSMSAGLSAGVPVEVLSRLDSSLVWKGIVSSVEMENNADGSESDGGWGGSGNDPMYSSSSYSFYVDLENTEGLLLGQHVYVRLDTGDGAENLLSLPQRYFVNLTTDEETFEKTALVYVPDEENKLFTTEVVLGEFDPNSNSYQILSGVDADTFVADPTASGCKPGAEVRFLQPTDLTGSEQEGKQE